MKKLLYQIVFAFLLIFQFSCGSEYETEAKNYKDAYLVTINDTIFLKLKGKRVPLHNPGTYEDSELIVLPRSDGRIKGEEIPTRKGYYKYKGYILINHDKLRVDLLIDNYDDKILDPLSWNGEYNLIRQAMK